MNNDKKIMLDTGNKAFSISTEELIKRIKYKNEKAHALEKDRLKICKILNTYREKTLEKESE